MGLFCLQVSHLVTYLFTKVVSPSHQYVWLTSSWVLRCPGCPADGELWQSWTTCLQRSGTQGTYIWPQNDTNLPRSSHSDGLWMKEGGLCPFKTSSAKVTSWSCSIVSWMSSSRVLRLGIFVVAASMKWSGHSTCWPQLSSVSVTWWVKTRDKGSA